MRILLVDDETALTEPLGRVLRREGYRVDVAADGASGRRLALAQPYDLLILDWMLPECSGVDLCRDLRRQDTRTPVLFLTAKDTVDDRVEGLDAGADDYLVKPFELKELLARVRALLRRSPSPESGEAQPPLTAHDLSLDVGNQVATRAGRVIELSEKETQLLALLMQQPGQILSHEDLLSGVWGSNPPGSNVLAAQIRLLRRKIDASGETPLILSVYGKGYRFAPAP